MEDKLNTIARELNIPEDIKLKPIKAEITINFAMLLKHFTDEE